MNNNENVNYDESENESEYEYENECENINENVNECGYESDEENDDKKFNVIKLHKYVTKLCLLTRTWKQIPVRKTNDDTIQKLKDVFDIFYEVTSWYCIKDSLPWLLMKWFKDEVTYHIISCLDVDEVKEFTKMLQTFNNFWIEKYRSEIHYFFIQNNEEMMKFVYKDKRLRLLVKMLKLQFN
jgi:hypothetical protein